MENSLLEMKTRLHWKNRKAFSLVIPPAFLQSNFRFFPRTNQPCLIRPVQSEKGRPALIVEFE